jgi:hypothetical protein
MRFAQVNVDGNSKTCVDFDIIGTRAMIFLKDGSDQWRLYGPQTREKLVEVIEEVLR